MQHQFFPVPPREGDEGLEEPPRGPYLRVVPLGGCGEIGRNMTVYETNDDIVVVDAGVQFPEEEMLGVDLVINDVTYLRERASKIRGLLLTHAHDAPAQRALHGGGWADGSVSRLRGCMGAR